MGEDKILTIEKPEGRRRCPSCAEENKNMLHESTDKKRIISDYPRVYGKKYRCGRCGLEWKEE
jgi:ribosomal protein S27AE